MADSTIRPMNIHLAAFSPRFFAGVTNGFLLAREYFAGAYRPVFSDGPSAIRLGHNMLRLFHKSSMPILLKRRAGVLDFRLPRAFLTIEVLL
jgi:hypothetical protein